MQRFRTRLTLAFLLTALFLLAFVVTRVSGGFVLARVANISLLRTVAQTAGILAAAGFFVAALIVAVPAALQPANWPRKLLYILPAYCIGFTLVGVILALLGIGTVGAFIAVWLAAGALLSIIAVPVAVSRMDLGVRPLRAALATLGVSGILSGIAWVAMVIAIVMVVRNPPTFGSFGPRGPRAEGGAVAQAATRDAGTASNSGAQAAAGTQSTAGARTATGTQFRREGERRAPSTTPMALGGGLMTVFLALEGWSLVRGWQAGGVLATESGPLAADDGALAEPSVPVAYGREIGRALLAAIALTLLIEIIGILIPVARSNPPVQTPIQWNSPQTQALAQRACMDCHSNETVWPAYASVPPGSWLLASHVNDGRRRLNLSELNNIPAFRRNGLVDEMAQQIRNGAMPPKDYLLVHPTARLTAAEKTQLIEGLTKSLAQSLPAQATR